MPVKHRNLNRKPLDLKPCKPLTPLLLMGLLSYELPGHGVLRSRFEGSRFSAFVFKASRFLSLKQCWLRNLQFCPGAESSQLSLVQFLSATKSNTKVILRESPCVAREWLGSDVWWRCRCSW